MLDSFLEIVGKLVDSQKDEILSLGESISLRMLVDSFADPVYVIRSGSLNIDLVRPSVDFGRMQPIDGFICTASVSKDV